MALAHDVTPYIKSTVRHRCTLGTHTHSFNFMCTRSPCSRAMACRPNRPEHVIDSFYSFFSFFISILTIFKCAFGQIKCAEAMCCVIQSVLFSSRCACNKNAFSDFWPSSIDDERTNEHWLEIENEIETSVRALVLTFLPDKNRRGRKSLN